MRTFLLLLTVLVISAQDGTNYYQFTNQFLPVEILRIEPNPNLIFHTSKGEIVVHGDTANVTWPTNMAVSEAVQEFWRLLGQAYPHILAPKTNMVVTTPLTPVISKTNGITTITFKP